uniref:Uncharacterized protein n=1 Tax=mine drainage metagenome TaxID=410659 RepID=E6PHU7_9ZZZZ
MSRRPALPEGQRARMWWVFLRRVRLTQCFFIFFKESRRTVCTPAFPTLALCSKACRPISRPLSTDVTLANQNGTVQ